MVNGNFKWMDTVVLGNSVTDLVHSGGVGKNWVSYYSLKVSQFKKKRANIREHKNHVETILNKTWICKDPLMQKTRGQRSILRPLKMLTGKNTKFFNDFLNWNLPVFRESPHGGRGGFSWSLLVWIISICVGTSWGFYVKYIFQTYQNSDGIWIIYNFTTIQLLSIKTVEVKILYHHLMST